MKGNMRGNLMDVGVPIIFGLLFIGILLGVGAIALSAMNPAQQASGSAWFNQSLVYQQTVFNNSLTGTGNLSAQFPAIGTIAGVALIIVILFVAIGGYILGKRE